MTTPPPTPQAEPEPRIRTRSRRLLVLVLLGAALVLAAAYLFFRFQLSPVSSTPQPIEVEILPSWGAARVAEALERRDLIRNARLFTLWLRYLEVDRHLGEGLYDLSPHLSGTEIARTLEAGGRPQTVRVVIPEGFRAQDVIERLVAAGLGERRGFEIIVREPREIRPSYVPRDAPLEGYLFPASYDFPLTWTPEALLELMVERFRLEIDGDTAEALLARNLTVHDWVTLASMVQAEAVGPEEMPIIAGVFLNRVDLGMALQSDPTVAYGLGKDLPELDVLAGDFQRDHAWNTYTRPDLPTGPISNPGRAALQSVLLPTRNDEVGRPYLYFLHGYDQGELVFRVNISLADHNRDVRRFLQ